MLHFLKFGHQFFFKPQIVRNVFLAGGSAATLGLLKKPTQEFMTNLNTVTPTKVNLVIGIGLLLVASNAFFAYKYFRLLSTNTKDEAPQESPSPASCK